MGVLCVEQSIYTCGGAWTNPLNNEYEGETCTYDGTDDLNPLPRQKCLDDLVPSLDERFQASARIACHRPMYQLHEPTGAADTLRLGYIMYGVGAGLLVCSLISNLMLPDSGGDES